MSWPACSGAGRARGDIPGHDGESEAGNDALDGILRHQLQGLFGGKVLVLFGQLRQLFKHGLCRVAFGFAVGDELVVNGLDGLAHLCLLLRGDLDELDAVFLHGLGRDLVIDVIGLGSDLGGLAHLEVEELLLFGRQALEEGLVHAIGNAHVHDAEAGGVLGDLVQLVGSSRTVSVQHAVNDAALEAGVGFGGLHHDGHGAQGLQKVGAKAADGADLHALEVCHAADGLLGDQVILRDVHPGPQVDTHLFVFLLEILGIERFHDQGADVGVGEEEGQVIDLGKVEGLGSIAGIAGRQVTNTGSNGTEALVGRVEDTVQEIAECKFPIAFFGDHFFPCLPSKLEDGIMLRIVCGKAYFNLLCKRIARL